MGRGMSHPPELRERAARMAAEVAGGLSSGLANTLSEYLEIFHNRRRRHSALGMLTPTEYELRVSAGAWLPGAARAAIGRCGRGWRARRARAARRSRAAVRSSSSWRAFASW